MMITRPASCIDETGRVRGLTLASVLEQHRVVAYEHKRMQDAYDGKQPITHRERTDGLPNNQLMHAFPRYIATMASGYLVGSPVAYAMADEAENATFSAIVELYDKMDADSVDAELAKDASICGVGVELCYPDENAEPCATVLEPVNAFVVYEDTVGRKPLFGVYYYQKVNELGMPDGTRVNVYTREFAFTYETTATEFFSADGMLETAAEQHFFGDVPIVEYWNNEERAGDFKPVMSLIDAYDVLQSDRINDKEQFVDALLVVYGVTLDEDADDPSDSRTAAQRLREDRLLQFLNPEARAEWLTKTLDEASTEVLKDSLKADIHKMSMVPDLTDENFAGNSSGVAMKYKLLGLEQLTKIKERWFREGLRTRLKLFASFLAFKGHAALDIAKVQIAFARALPNNDLETAQMASAASGIISKRTLAKQFSFVDNVDVEIEMVAQEADEAMQRQKDYYDDYPDANKREDANATDSKDDDA